MPAMYHAANFAKCVSYECKNVYETGGSFINIFSLVTCNHSNYGHSKIS
jgi:hypothetical protein